MFDTTIQADKLEQILDLAKKSGASACEIIQKSSTENPVSFENNKLKSLESNHSSGIAVRLIKDNKIGISSTTDPETVESLVASALETSEFGTEATFELSKEKIQNNLPDESSQKPSLESLIEKGTDVVEHLRKFHNDLMVSGGFDCKEAETIYLNSNGVTGTRKKTICSVMFHTLLVHEDDFLGIYEEGSSLNTFPDEKKIRDSLFEKLNLSKNITPLHMKHYPVLFTPRAVEGIFYEIFLEILNGKTIEQGISPVADKLGKKLFDEQFTLTEVPSMGTNRALFDDEGIKTQKKDLIKDGVINSFYFDLSSGRRVTPRHDSTGNGFKPSLASMPFPSLTSVIMEKGKKKYSEMLSSISEGILVDQLLGSGQSNTLAGEFSVGIDLGFKIKNGKIEGRIKNCMVAGNIFEVLSKIGGLSQEQEWVNGSMCFPAMLIENMMVAGK